MGWRVSITHLIRVVESPPTEIAWAWALEHDAEAPPNVRILGALDDAPTRPPRRDELWLLFIAPSEARASALHELLSRDERDRAERFEFEPDRWTAAAGRAALRHLLGRMLRRAPNELRFALGSHGKPALVGDAIAFNISHTRGLVALAFAGTRVGLDVEPARSMPDLMAIAQLAYAREMRDALHACTDEVARTALFFRFWTLGESYIKATGEGVSQGLTSFAFAAHPPRLLRASPAWGPPPRWRFYASP